jgi:hypothetical protein
MNEWMIERGAAGEGGPQGPHRHRGPDPAHPAHLPGRHLAARRPPRARRDRRGRTHRRRASSSSAHPDGTLGDRRPTASRSSATGSTEHLSRSCGGRPRRGRAHRRTSRATVVVARPDPRRGRRWSAISAACGSGHQNRDRAVQSRYLDTDEHPEAVFVLTDPVPFDDRLRPGLPFSVEADGTLTVREVEQAVTFPLEVRWDGDVVHVAGQLPIRLTDFDIAPPDIGGFVRVEDEAVVEVELRLTRQSA